MIRLAKWLKLICELGKIRIAQLVTLSTATGYILASGKLSLDIIISVSGVFILALGSGALNQYQERHKDRLMVRTKSRPIPSGRIKPAAALLVSLLFLFGGSGILFWGTNNIAFFLGLLAVFWYNGVYTYLKQLTSWAVIPGSLIGSLPPLIGWASASGTILSPQALALATFFFIWQIPHFWLLLLHFGDDYAAAGYPSLTNVLNRKQLGRLTFILIVATAIAIVFLPLYGLGKSQIVYILIFIIAILLIWNSIYLLRPESAKFSYRSAFKGINLFILLIMFLLALDRLIKIG